MVKKVIHGTGITARERTEYDPSGNTPGDMEAFMNWLDGAGRSIEEKGLFGAETELMREVCEEILDGKDRSKLPEADSDEDFARRILHSVRCVDNSIAEGASDHAAKFAVIAGRIWTEAVFKKKWEKKIQGKQRQEAALSKASAARKLQAAENPPEWWDGAFQDACEVKAKFPSYTRWRVAGHLQEKYPAYGSRSQRAISEAIRKMGFDKL